MRLFALRGANSVESNRADEILAATGELMTELMARNDLDPEAMVSCIFTVTDDLDAEFPAVAARRLGLHSVPLLCARRCPCPAPYPASSGCSSTTTRRTTTARATCTWARRGR